MSLIHLVNDSPHNFWGWLRCAIDWLPPHQPRGYIPDALGYELGNRTGLDTHHIDVSVGLGPGERKTFDLATALRGDYNPLDGVPAHGPSMWGGIPVSVADTQLEFVGGMANGAAIDGHWHGRIGPLVHIDLWVSWYPDQPSWCRASLVICASNPAVPDIKQFIPDGFVLRFGDAEVMAPGLLSWDLMEEGDSLADGQARILGGIVFCWGRHAGSRGVDDLMRQCRAVADQQVQIRGLRNLHLTGNPRLPAGFDSAKWAREMRPKVIEAQHDWFNGPLDQAYVSGAAGAQAGQSFIGGPAMADALGVGVLHIAGLDASWPMFHLEESGQQLDWKAHPGLRLFYGKVNLAITTDKLGKTAWPTSADSHSYLGPEDEHWFLFPEFAAKRLTGDPAAEWVLRGHAIHFLFRYVTVPPGNWLSANRAMGWMLLMCVELWRNLTDRDLAEAVRARCVDLLDQLVIPQFQPDGWGWIPWPQNERIGGTEHGPRRAIPWQASVFALGLHWAGTCFDHWGARNFGRHVARQVVERAYVKQGERWVVRDVICEDSSDPGPHFGGYQFFGMPFAAAVLLAYEAEHQQAKEIQAQNEREAVTWEAAAWLAPTGEPTP